MGPIPDCLGGLMRAMVCNEVPLVLKPGELDVTCAVAGSLAAVVAGLAGLSTGADLLIRAATVFPLRAGSLAFGWRLPIYRAESWHTQALGTCKANDHSPILLKCHAPAPYPTTGFSKQFKGFWTRVGNGPCLLPASQP